MSEFRAEPGAGRAGYAPRAAVQRQVRERTRAPWPPQQHTVFLPVELAAFEGILDQAVLETAARRAKVLGVGGDEVLRNHGIVSADLLVEALAKKLGVEVDRLNDDAPPQSPRLLEAANSGVLTRTTSQGDAVLTAAPRGLAIRRLAEALHNDPRLKLHLRLASPERLASHIRRMGATELAREAVLHLYIRRPDLSAANRARHPLRWLAISVAVAMIIWGMMMPGEMLLTIEYFLGISFLT